MKECLQSKTIKELEKRIERLEKIVEKLIKYKQDIEVIEIDRNWKAIGIRRVDYEEDLDNTDKYVY